MRSRWPANLARHSTRTVDEHSPQAHHVGMNRRTPNEQVAEMLFHGARSAKKRKRDTPSISAEFKRPRDEKWWK